MSPPRRYPGECSSLRYQPQGKRIKTHIGLILIAALVVAAFASPALAQDPSPTESQYSAPIPAEAGQSGSDEEPTGMRSNIGPLPFTGLDLLILGGLAAILFGTGFLLRKLSAPRRPGPTD